METSQFDSMYFEAIQASGYPTKLDRAELCVNLLKDPAFLPSSSDIAPVLTFFRLRLASNDVPLNWLLGSRDEKLYQPEAQTFRDAVLGSKKLVVSDFLPRPESKIRQELEIAAFTKALLNMESHFGHFPSEKELKQVDVAIRAMGSNYVVDITITPFQGPPLRIQHRQQRPIKLSFSPFGQ